MSQKMWRKADNTRVPMADLSEQELQNAFLTMCEVEYARYKEMCELQEKINCYADVKDGLKEEARKRGITLVYPDQADPKKKRIFKNYFEAERHTETIPTEPKVVIAATRD